MTPTEKLNAALFLKQATTTRNELAAKDFGISAGPNIRDIYKPQASKIDVTKAMGGGVGAGLKAARDTYTAPKQTTPTPPQAPNQLHLNKMKAPPEAKQTTPTPPQAPNQLHLNKMKAPPEVKRS